MRRHHIRVPLFILFLLVHTTTHRIPAAFPRARGEGIIPTETITFLVNASKGYFTSTASRQRWKEAKVLSMSCKGAQDVISGNALISTSVWFGQEFCGPNMTMKEMDTAAKSPKPWTSLPPNLTATQITVATDRKQISGRTTGYKVVHPWT